MANPTKAELLAQAKDLGIEEDVNPSMTNDEIQAKITEALEDERPVDPPADPAPTQAQAAPAAPASEDTSAPGGGNAPPDQAGPSSSAIDDDSTVSQSGKDAVQDALDDAQAGVDEVDEDDTQADIHAITELIDALSNPKIPRPLLRRLADGIAGILGERGEEPSPATGPSLLEQAQAITTIDNGLTSEATPRSLAALTLYNGAGDEVELTESDISGWAVRRAQLQGGIGTGPAYAIVIDQAGTKHVGVIEAETLT